MVMTRTTNVNMDVGARNPGAGGREWAAAPPLDPPSQGLLCPSEYRPALPCAVAAPRPLACDPRPSWPPGHGWESPLHPCPHPCPRWVPKVGVALTGAHGREEEQPEEAEDGRGHHLVHGPRVDLLVQLGRQVGVVEIVPVYQVLQQHVHEPWGKPHGP